MAFGPNELGELLRAHRVRAGLTQQELADRAEVSVRAVRYIEQGRVAKPRAASMRRLAEVVGLVLDGRTDVRIGVLGSLSVRTGAGPVDIGPSMPRSLLGLLALQPNRVVTREEIVDVLWGEHPPKSSLNLVYTYVARLRRALDPAQPITAAHGGYMLKVDDNGLDALRFDDLATQARRLTSDDPHTAEALFVEALQCWRGGVLVDMPDRLRQHPAALALAQRRLAAALSHADLAMGLGLHEQAAVQLQRLTGEDPLHGGLHEGLNARLMLALAGSGQQAAALRLFGDVRDRLADELGVRPGAEMREAHLRILQREAPTVTTMAPPTSRSIPAQLPADVTGFAGREAQIEALDALVPEGSQTTAVVIVAIEGIAGVGKTALAVHWAHRVRNRYPDGQLYVDLRGYASGAPVRPLDALSRFLHALGVPAEQVPIDVDEGMGLYRTLLANRRVLIVLDNASGVDQVRPLLPGSAGCLVLVTSRGRLGGLSAREGAHRLALDGLHPDEAKALLARTIGADRMRDDPASVADLLDACAYLPLALRIAAANINSGPNTEIAAYTADLRRQGRLAGLAVEGDEQGAVQAAFDLSYAQLEPDSQNLFRLLGLVPGSDFSADAAIAVTAGTPAKVRRWLGHLVSANLVHPEAGDRYKLHDLLAEYAGIRAREDDIGPALVRLLDFYLHTAQSATRLLFPDTTRLPAPKMAQGVHVPELADETEALSWLDAERPNLIAAVNWAATAGPRRYAWLITDALRGYFISRGHGVDGLEICHVALEASRQEGDQFAEASMLDILGLVYYNLSDYQRAITEHNEALALNRKINNRAGEAASLHSLGRVHSQLGRPAQAASYYSQALTINRETGNRVGEATGLNYIGVAQLSLGRPDQALSWHKQSITLARELGNRYVEARALNGAGLAHWAMGELDNAVQCHLRALATCRQIGDRHGEVSTIICLAETHCDAGRYRRAVVLARTGITQGRQLGERRHEVSGLEIVATAHMRRGHMDIALSHYREALQLARDIEFRYGETSVLIGMSAVLRRAGHVAEALTAARDALAVMRDSGMRLLEARALTVLALGYLAFNDFSRAHDNAQQALTIARKTGQRLVEAWARQAKGQVLRGLGETGDALVELGAAEAILTALGVPPVDH
ncbi:DNA-binding SARP family transcriptional activator/Tfp pilus assembly protein PilF/DNA-binding XRE family transcriptional regulator [Kibdelosporangium banguiense]|uniref:DNA-binding SARP family transcriptional activator/Tfp pilus assembly protein PilF/DNA-binding XRE family transcriptional regulator n=1 Tax=Kibdelosporangium banguiense TaxID=1365924 RepID=A0ABS4T6S9_9PSEU|nr:tetratricopeptide repeat protein [Kibdelosporangium banguiense]MBP2320125.1 DNA-binding SARP family transcriptional activator/Tfp pilus assembly protein PilF/DNA-binding XRE family transcriptional regulator [Kibdelosporangium banguiense]